MNQLLRQLLPVVTLLASSFVVAAQSREQMQQTAHSTPPPTPAAGRAKTKVVYREQPAVKVVEKVVYRDRPSENTKMAEKGNNRDRKEEEALATINGLFKKDPSKFSDLQNDLANISNKNSSEWSQVYALVGEKQYLRVDSMYNVVLTAHPKYAPGYLARAYVNSYIDPEARQGLAKPYYEKYIELSKSEGADPVKFWKGVVEAYGYLGYYYYRRGNKSAALSHWQNASGLDPDNLKINTAISKN